MSERTSPQVWTRETAPRQHIEQLEGVPLEGHVEVATRARCDQMLVLEVHMDRGSRSNLHQHDADSAGYLITGKVRAWVAGEESILHPGDAFVHPKHVDHWVEALDDSHWIEIKSPPIQPF